MTSSQGDPLPSWLLSIGLSKRDIGLICKDLDRWIANSGMEWTIKRLKSLRAAYIQFLGGNPYELPWLSNRKQNGNLIPKGIWGKFWTRDETRVPVSLKVFHLYSRFTLTKVSETQRMKFLDSVWAMPVLRFEKQLQVNVSEYAYSHSFKSKPYRRSLIASVNALPPDHRKKFTRDFRRGVDYMTRHNRWFPDITCSWGGFDRWIQRKNDLVNPQGDDFVGNLGITQERGGKLRVFAFPNLLFQVMMNPLKASLFRILRKIPEDCTYDQERGVKWVEEKLRAGHCAWSVDLSDATNHFPYELQKLVLLNIFLNSEWENHLELFEMVSKGRYGASAIGGKHVVWTKGQPLGAGPSFALFAIAHHAVLHHCKVVVGEKDTDCYRILGDDIVITNPAVATKYLEVLSSLSIPVSPSKTIISKDLAEFAGVIIHKNLGAIPSTKWKTDINLGNVTSEYAFLKHRGASLLPKQWSAVYLQWYSVYHYNVLGMTRDQRLNCEVDVITYQEEREKKRVLLKDRSSARSLYWSIISDDPMENIGTTSPDQGDASSPDEPFGFSPVEVPAALPSASYGPRFYSTRETKVFRKSFGGELRSFRQAVRPYT